MGENTLTLLHHNRARIASLLKGKTGAGEIFRLRRELQEVDRALALLGSELCNEETSGDIHDGKENREEIGKAEYSVRDYLTNQLAGENRASDPPAGRKQNRRFAHFSNPVPSWSSKF